MDRDGPDTEVSGSAGMPALSPANGSLGSEIIARVVVSKAEGRAREEFPSRRNISNPLRAFYDFRA